MPQTQQVIKATLPVMFGYIPLGIAFGILFQNLGYAWYFAPLMGIIVFAGAAQFMAVGLLAANAGLFEIFAATLILNSRHMFFGLSVLNRYTAKGWRKLYMIYTLTDETYSLVTSTQPPEGSDSNRYYLMISALNHSYWVIGCAIGALLGSRITFDSTGMDFALTALFTVLMIEQWKQVKESFPFVVALIAGLMSIMLWPQHMLIAAIGLSLLVLIFQARVKGEIG